MPAQIGWIGLGTMGRPLAHNLLAAGHRLAFFARRKEVIDELTTAGGQACDSPADVMRSSEVVFTMVTADPQVEEVALGPRGLREGAEPGKLWIEMSTIAPQTIRTLGAALAERGVATLDAPVSGGPWGAAAGTLAIMVGGEVSDLERARPLFEVLGKSIFHLGPLGAGQSVKLVNQVLAGGALTLIAEALVLAKAAGLDLETVTQVIGASSGNSAMFEARARKFILAGNYPPGFTTELMRKDVALALELATALGVATPVTTAALGQYTAALALGQGPADFSAVTRVVERASRVQLS